VSLNLVLVQGHREAAFYLPFTRAWELLAGSAIAMAKIRWQRWGSVTSTLGLALIIGAAIGLHAKSTFPGWRAGIPVTDCALLLASPVAWLNRRILATPSLVAIGLINLPALSLAWPALVLAETTLEDLGAGTRIAILGLSVELAGATYFMVRDAPAIMEATLRQKSSQWSLRCSA